MLSNESNNCAMSCCSKAALSLWKAQFLNLYCAERAGKRNKCQKFPRALERKGAARSRRKGFCVVSQISSIYLGQERAFLGLGMVSRSLFGEISGGKNREQKAEVVEKGGEGNTENIVENIENGH